jgi:hypothetical protein
MKKNQNNIYIVGDLNCQSYKLMMKIELRKIKNSHIIILGNFGIGQLSKNIEEKNLNKYNEQLKINNNKLYLLHGNKDNYNLFKTYKYSNIIFALKYSIIKINKINFLFIGGSISLDRIYNFDLCRKKPKPFLPSKLPINFHVDIVLSHDSASYTYPHNSSIIKSFSKYDKWLYNDFKKNRTMLSEVYDELIKRKCNIKTWYCSKYDKDIIEKKNITNFIQIKNQSIIQI